MVPMRHSTIFKSRWMALVWAAGIVWFALDVAGTPGETANSAANADGPAPGISPDEAAAIDTFLGR